jgi:hypothetical protein
MTPELYEQFGRLKVELDWVKKSCEPRLTTCGGWSSRTTRS